MEDTQLTDKGAPGLTAAAFSGSADTTLLGLLLMPLHFWVPRVSAPLLYTKVTYLMGRRILKCRSQDGVCSAQKG